MDEYCTWALGPYTPDATHHCTVFAEAGLPAALAVILMAVTLAWLVPACMRGAARRKPAPAPKKAPPPRVDPGAAAFLYKGGAVCVRCAGPHAPTKNAEEWVTPRSAPSAAGR